MYVVCAYVHVDARMYVCDYAHVYATGCMYLCVYVSVYVRMLHAYA